MLVISALDTTTKKKNGSVNLLSCVIMYSFMVSIYVSTKVLFSHGMHDSSLQVLWRPNK